MTTLFAQADLGSLKAEFIKSLVIAVIALGVFLSFVVAAVMAVLQYRLEKRSREREDKRAKEPQPREIHPNPLQVSLKPQKVSGAVLKQMHDDLEARVDAHEEEISQLRDDHMELSTDIRKQLGELPGKIVADMLNAKKLFDK